MYPFRCSVVFLAVFFLCSARCAPLDEDEDVWQNVLEENDDLIEGDIIPDLKRNAASGEYRRWHNGIVPYTISDKYFFFHKNAIRDAMTDLENKVKVGSKHCIRFVPWNPTMGQNRLNIVNGKGCSSHVGMQRSGAQTLSLAAGLTVTCIKRGIIQHELMHALGFYHEQSRYDRDEYVTVHWDNIKSGHQHNFRKMSSSSVNHQGQPYDYGSVMHYGETEFGVWGLLGPKKTITANRKGFKIGQRKGPSDIDVKEIRLLYKCV